MMSTPDQQTNKAFKPSVLKSISADGSHEYTLGDFFGRFKKDDLNVKINKKLQNVTVIGDNRQCKGDNIHFKQVLEVVSPDVDIEKTSATYNSIDGTLTLKIPKRTTPPTNPQEPQIQADDNTNQPANEMKNGRQLEVAQGGGVRCWRDHLTMEKLPELSTGDNNKMKIESGQDYWENEEMEVSVKGAIERRRKKKAIIFTAAIAFGLGFYLSYKLLGSSSSSGGGVEGSHESIHSINTTIVERYISNRCPCANDIKNSDGLI